MFSHPLILMRHGVTAWNVADRYQGMTDTHLIQAGREQALANAQAIEAFIRVYGVDRAAITIASSPLTRAQQSAQIVAERLNISQNAITTIDAMRELTLGRWEGLNNLKVKDMFYEERKSRKADLWNFKPVDGESLADRAPEVAQALKTLKPYTVIVTHAGILRIAHHLLGNHDKQSAAAMMIPHEGLLHFDGKTLHTIAAA